MLRKLIVIAIATSFAITLHSSTASALSGADWKPGRIIDTGIFRDSTTMNTQQIQAFLNSKVPSCDTWGTQAYGSTTRGQYGTSKGYPPPYTCLKDYTQNGKSAAQIIYDYAQQYRINPQVILVLLQKEQSLITDDWPWSNQYRSATGYGCPDTAACDGQYYGFDNQVRWANRMYQAISDADPGWYSPYLPGNNYVKWHPDFFVNGQWVDQCGGSNVFIESRATAALYSYTPYQPNTTALSNIYGGQDDGCSSYGNRNFWRLFNDWFGSTLTPEFSAQPVWQQIYTDSSKTVAAGWNASLLTGQNAYAVVVMKNTGNTSWTRTGAFGSTDTRLATYDHWGRTSVFCDGNWVLNCSRPASLKEASVAPGEYGTFEFSLRAPAQPGSYIEAFAPIVDGRTVFSGGAMTFHINVIAPTFTAQPVWQQVYSDSSKSAALGWNASLVAGQSAYAVVVMKNTGNMNWTKSTAFGTTDTRLATYGHWGRTSKFCDNNWLINCTRPSPLVESVVAPGQYGTFEFPIRAPLQAGSYSEAFAPVVDGRTVFSSGAMTFNINVSPATFTAQPVWQQVYSDSSKSAALGWNATLSPGQNAYLVTAMKNTGNATWTKSTAFGTTDTRLATYGHWGRTSKFCDNNWLINCTRPSPLNETSVAPGQVGTFEFPIKAPLVTGHYVEVFSPVVDGRTTFTNGVVSFNLTVQ